MVLVENVKAMRRRNNTIIFTQRNIFVFIAQLKLSQWKHMESLNPVLLCPLFPPLSILNLFCHRVFHHVFPDLIRPTCVCVSRYIVLQAVRVDRRAKRVMFALGFSSVLFVEEVCSALTAGALAACSLLLLVAAVNSYTLGGLHLVGNKYNDV